MKISEVINALIELRVKYGDLSVVIPCNPETTDFDGNIRDIYMDTMIDMVHNPKKELFIVLDNYPPLESDSV